MVISMNYNKKSGRPKLFSTEEMAEVLYQVFAEKGFMATSISDLTQATGTKPASLYLAFGNKEGMYTAALGHYRRVWLRGLEEILNDKNTSFHQRIASFLSAAFTVFSCEGKPPGCLMTFTALNMQGENSEIGNQLRHERERFQVWLTEEAAAAQKKNELPGELTPSEFASLIITIENGLALSALDRPNPQDIQRMLERFTALLFRKAV